MLPYPQATLPTLEALYRLGKDVCHEIEEFHPDIVIGLAHSGWMPIVVAQTLWKATKDKPFPPSIRTNIGQEKIAIYHAQYGTSFPSFCCGECCDGPGRKGHYLAWVAEQNSWLNTLHDQIEAIFSKTPERILVVDDVFGGYRTGYTTLALLEELYPEAKATMCAGKNDLTDNFVTGWLEQNVPALAKEIRDIQEKSAYRKRYASPWHETLKPLINGTEDITAESLNLKFITRESHAVKALEDYVAAEVALSASAWAHNLACTYALQRQTDEIMDDQVADPGEDHDHLFPRWRLLIHPPERLAAKAWRQGGITNAAVIQAYGKELTQLKKGMREVSKKHGWLTHDESPGAIYLPVEAGETWINIYPPTENSPAPDFPVSGFAEFQPGKVWAGLYPALYNNLEPVFLKDLLQLGIDLFVDLTNPSDFHQRYPYREALLRVSHEMGKSVELRNFPLPYRSNPTASQVEQVIGYIHRELKTGRHIYIHAGYNLDARTPLILACLLMERDASPKQALTKANEFWMKVLHFLIIPPLSGEQAKFILNWKSKR